MTRAALAIELYRLEHHTLPHDLASLVTAGYLPHLPHDFYGNQPLQFDPAKKALWSVGLNLKDDGCSKKRIGGVPEDIVMHVAP
jgi:hypothetical protein